ncbi:outer membrane protein with beta-barrel domain [Winogradskyella wandonensis]|uniref:Outer membrane protein with beta-barrel domain n=1 Tax=Winogradskyella wandonensis TaxID=1442586 RepID=A0A4R1KKS2_9FLAO|nr:porin family protein [Winogradskyella wandonensis]TCK65000.1 outer membrane protein with beta-barrel domain [Winogradskyella wandonensis]
MIKKVLLFLTVFSSLSALSQINYGVTTGLNISRLNEEFKAVNGSFFNTSSMGLKLGMFSEIPINDKILLSPKLIYSQMGDRDKNYDSSRSLDASNIDYKLDYLTIPLNVRFFDKLYVEVGPQIGILINDSRESLDLGDLDSSIDIGANLEFGYKINDFRVGLNVYHGFTNVFEIEQTPPLSFRDLNIRNFALSFNLNYIVFSN